MPKPSTPYPQSDRELLRLIERSPGHRAGYKQLIRELGLGGGRERRLLLEQLARMCLRKELVKLDTGHWTLPSATPEKTARKPAGEPGKDRAPAVAASPRWVGSSTRENLVAGRLDLHRDGFGFVRPNGSTRREDDLFIPPHDLNGAMQGDEVLVDEAPPGRPGADGKPRRSGRIARILTRRNPTVVGIFHYARPHGRRGGEAEPYSTAKFHYVTPLDERMTQPILIPFGSDGAPELPAAPTENRVLGEEAQRERAAFTPPASSQTSSSSGKVEGPAPLPSTESVLQSSQPLRDAWVPDPDLSQHPLEGLAVDIEITDFPTLGRPARGRILEVLGHPDAFGVDVEIVIRKHHLPHVFPANVLAEAEDSARDTVAVQTDDELSYRVDFRGLPIVTIDGETARDFDDAVLVQPLPNGNWQLQVHIADVSHYVRPGTDLDLEARLRGTSVYFPDRAVPMLPPALSSGMCSLRPDEDRLVLSCIAEIDARGEVAEYKLCEGIIRSARRMTYTQVQAILDTMQPGLIPPDPGRKGSIPTIDPGPLPPDLGISASESERQAYDHHQQQLETRIQFLDFVPHFEQMYELALKLNRKRHRRGSIDFDLPEPVIRFDPQGNTAAITRSERGWSNRLIEEFMLTANECVAHWLEQQGDSIYRIHELPDPKRILDFEEVAATYGQSLGFPSLPVKQFQMKSDRRSARSNAERFGGKPRKSQTHDVPESIPVTPQMYQKLTARIAGTPEERILSYLMLRSLKQARYSEKNEGHFALASPSYTHFTSPIRRYPDLIIHRLLRAALRSGADPEGAPILSTDPQPWSSKRPLVVDHGPSSIPLEELQSIASESSQSERRADDAERELMEWKKLKFMEPRVGEEFSATVLSCTKYGFYVELDDLFIEGLVPIQTIADSLPFGDPDRFVFRDTDRVIVGTHSGRVFRLGQRVHVLLDRIDRPNRRLQFALVPSREPQGEAPRSLRKPRTAKPEHPSPNRAGKPAAKGRTKSRTRDRKAKGKGKRKR